MKYKTEWNLGLLYKNEKDPQIEKDMQAIEKACAVFEKKYKGKNFTTSADKLLRALKDYEKLLSDSTYKPYWYFHLYKSIKTDNKAVAALEAQMNERQRKAFNKVLFFQLDLGKIPKTEQIKYLKDTSIQHFRYFLEKIFNKAVYDLSEKEEQVLSLLSQPANEMWYNAQQKLLSQQIIEHKNKKISLSEATERFGDLPTKSERATLYSKVIKARKSTAYLAEPELNAIYTTKKISDELRGYKEPYSETVRQYENDEKEIQEFIKTVTSYFSVSKKYFALHAKLIKDKKPTIADIYVKIGTLKREFNFDSAIAIVKKAFGRFDTKYVVIFESYLQQGQIDVYPRKSKRGGGFCSGLGTLPVYIFLNHVNTLKSVETLAHELGHAFHTELSKPLDPLYGEYTISVAEVASTFFEQFVADEVLQDLPDNEKIIVLHDRINRDIATIFRQVACFNCELELHRMIRSKGFVSKEEMAEIMRKHLQSYIGKAITITEDDGYVFTTWSHLRYSFYVYSYAYGLLISRALYEKWKQDNSFKQQVEKFLSSGNSMTPKDIFKSIGINTNAEFFETGLKSIKSDIDQLEKLAKKQKLIK